MVKGMQNLLFNDIIEKAEGLFAEADEEARVHFVDEDAERWREPSISTGSGTPRGSSS